MENRVWTLAGIVAALLLAVALAFFVYTHPALHRIPSDLGGEHRITFYAIGDQGTGGLAQWAVARAMEKQAEKDGNLDFVVLLGDNFYTGHTLTLESPEWQSMFENVYSGTYLSVTPFYAVLGNHDYLHVPRQNTADCPARALQCYVLEEPAVQVEYARRHLGSNRWRMPDKYYSADFGKAGVRPLLRVVFLDTNLSQPDLEKEANFIRQQFGNGAYRPVWKIAVGHHPVRTYGKHYGEGNESVDILLAAMKETQVDLYLSGHDHNQQLIARNGEPVYIINGAGGSGTYRITRQSPDLRYARAGHGFVRVRVDNAQLRFDFYDTSAAATASYKIARSCTSGQASCLQPALR